MITAWKKLLNKQEITTTIPSDVQPNSTIPHGVEKLNKQLQLKFRNGIDYNLKILIIGDTRVGKTSLFNRLKSEPFNADYIPSEDLKVTSIDWNYRTNNDVVKLDVWEVVETAVRRSPVSNDLKLTTNQKSCPEEFQSRPTFVKISETIDIYKNTNAVILMFNMEKTWTFKYIQNKMDEIPKELPVLILANFRDMGHHRTVTAEQVEYFIKSLDRTPCDGRVLYTECSMRNGYGMKFIERFFNIPFLKLQEATLLKQLELNRQETMSTMEELTIIHYDSNEEYEKYIELETIRRRMVADSLSQVNSSKISEFVREEIRNGAISGETFNENNKPITSIESKKPLNNDKKTAAQIAAEAKFKNNQRASIVFGAKNPLPDAKMIQIGKVDNNKNIHVNKDESKDVSNQTRSELSQSIKVAANKTGTSIKHIQDKQDSNGHKTKNDHVTDDEDDDDEDDNPMIADYGSDIDSDDLSS